MNLALPGIAGLGAPELILIVLVLVLLFGAKKLPELARGSGRALRIFKSETKGLMTDDDEPATTTPPISTQAIQSSPVAPTPPIPQQPVETQSGAEPRPPVARDLQDPEDNRR